MNFLAELNTRDIWISVNGDDKLGIDAPQGTLTEQLLKHIKASKAELVEALQSPWKVIDYDASRLAGEMPKHYEWIDDERIRASYFTRAELLWHMDQVSVAAMVATAKGLGGVVAGTVTDIPGRQAEEQPQQTELMSA